MKVLFAARGLPVCDYRVVLRRDWERAARRHRRRARARAAASRCSSSRPTSGRASASRRPRTRPACARRWTSPARSTARSSSRRPCRTRARSSARVLGNDEPEASVAGEVIPSREFYDYEAKYLDEGSKTVIPADLPRGGGRRDPAARRSRRSRPSTAPAWRASISCSSRDTGAIFVNEVNTIPGFTTISMYSKLWEASRRRLPGAARSPRRAGARTPRREAATAHQRPMIRDAGCSWLSVAWLAAAPASLTPACRHRPAPTRRAPRRSAATTAWSAPTTSSSTRASTQRRRRAAPARAARRRSRRAQVLDATALWWRIQLDPDSRALDDEFSTAVERAIAHDRSLDRPRARRCRSVVLSRRRVRARACSGACCATSGSPPRATASASRRRSNARSRSIPTLDDAYFGIGLYRYYADVAPAAAKILRLLLLLPGGDRDEGLAQMLRARDRGGCSRARPTTSCTSIYLWYEQQTGAGARAARGPARSATRGNPLFLTQIAEIQDVYQHDVDGEPRELARAAGAGARRPGQRAGARRGAGAARASPASSTRWRRPTRRSSSSSASSRCSPTRRTRRWPLAYLRLGEAHDRLDARAERSPPTARRAAGAIAPVRSRPRQASASTSGARRPSACGALPTRSTREAYRLSLEGWRALERNDCRGRRRRSTRALALDPRDPVARYRYGRVLQARGDDAGALAEFEHAIRDARRAPAPIVGEACLEAARIHERGASTVDEAHRRVSHRASTSFGAVAPTRSARRERALAPNRSPWPRAIASTAASRVIASARDVDPRSRRSADRDRRSRDASASRDHRCVRVDVRDRATQRDRARADKKIACRFLTFRALCA